jgi:hypothetical protein
MVWLKKIYIWLTFQMQWTYKRRQGTLHMCHDSFERIENAMNLFTWRAEQNSLALFPERFHVLYESRRSQGRDAIPSLLRFHCVHAFSFIHAELLYLVGNSLFSIQVCYARRPLILHCLHQIICPWPSVSLCAWADFASWEGRKFRTLAASVL